MAAILDEADARIVSALQENADISNQELAARVHLSPAPCLRRVRRLRERGVIRGTVALVDPLALGLETEAYAFVTLETQRAGAGEQFERLLRKRPEIVECVRISGTHDYLLRVVVTSMRAYSDFLDQHLLRAPSVRSVHTSFSLGVLKRTTALPLPARQR
jgi:Lrp/AsnC family leucine-responsive transcriptional regulator